MSSLDFIYVINYLYFVDYCPFLAAPVKLKRNGSPTNRQNKLKKLNFSKHAFKK